MQLRWGRRRGGGSGCTPRPEPAAPIGIRRGAPLWHAGNDPGVRPGASRGERGAGGRAAPPRPVLLCTDGWEEPTPATGDALAVRIRTFDAEHDNLRTALEGAIELESAETTL